MIEHICAECKHQYYMISKNHLKCMNENSENYGEDIEPNNTCNKWEDRWDRKESVDGHNQQA